MDPPLGVSIDGVPAGEAIDMEVLQAFLDRRAPAESRYSTPRKESDQPEFLSGVLNGRTTGSPIAAIILATATPDPAITARCRMYLVQGMRITLPAFGTVAMRMCEAVGTSPEG